ncbi:MAG: hypothetical protein K1X64_19450 [Myxococcaceae bacterium]|nr:hypothetical protein [Myxococcaceae bacterium]
MGSRTTPVALMAVAALTLWQCGGGGNKADGGMTDAGTGGNGGGATGGGSGGGLGEGGGMGGGEGVGGGGATGGSAGYDAGPEDPRCRVLSAPAALTTGGYELNGDFTYGRVADVDPASITDGGGFNVFDVEVYWFNGITPPKTESYTAQTTFQTCEICTFYSEDCDALDRCDRRYLARRGQTHVARADPDSVNGRLQATSTDLTLFEWNQTLDAPVPDGGCVIIRSGAVDAGWGNPVDSTDNDGGM